MITDPRAFDAEALAAAVPQPPLADLRNRARARTRRRRRGTAGAAVLAAVAAAPLAFTPGTPPPPPAPPDAVVAERDVWVGDRAYAIAVERPADTCMPSLTITHDGGRTWSTPVAAADPPCRRGDSVGDDALPAEVHLRVLARDVYLLRVDGSARLTRDGGATWADLDAAVTDVPAFPAAATLASCGGCVPGGRPLAVDPATATVYRLASPMPAAPAEVCGTPDGALWAWLPGDREAPSRPGAGFVARSVDRGRTWESSAGPGGRVAAIACRSAATAYLLIQGDAGRPAAVATTRDGGRGWRRAAAPAGTRLVTADASGTVTVWVAADGRTLTATGDGEGPFRDGPAAPGVALGHDGDRTWVADSRTVTVVAADGRWTMPLPPWWAEPGVSPSPGPGR